MKRAKKAKKGKQSTWPRDVPEYTFLRGWIKRGIARDQKVQGWMVYVEKPEEDALPVTIVQGHHRR